MSVLANLNEVANKLRQSAMRSILVTGVVKILLYTDRPNSVGRIFHSTNWINQGQLGKMCQWEVDFISARSLLWLIDKFSTPVLTKCRLKAAKYEIQKPSTCLATLFRCKFSSMFPVFHLARPICPATNVVPQQKHLLRVEERCCEKSSAGLL